MANSVDPEQSAPEEAVRSGSALFAYTTLLEALVFKKFLGHLRYLQNVVFSRFLCYHIYPKYWNTLTPYHICPKI